MYSKLWVLILDLVLMQIQIYPFLYKGLLSVYILQLEFLLIFGHENSPYLKLVTMQ